MIDDSLRRKQFSIIARFEGESADDDDDDDDDDYYDEEAPVVIVGSHQDTVRGGLLREGRAPGADDDGSGTVTTLEAFTILCKSGFKPKFPVEFHWYSAEEMGLLGSQDVSSAYQRSNVRVMGMMQVLFHRYHFLHEL